MRRSVRQSAQGVDPSLNALEPPGRGVSHVLGSWAHGYGSCQTPRRTRQCAPDAPGGQEQDMIATVQIAADGTIVAVLDSDDIADDDDERNLAGLQADSMLEQCSRVAIDTFFSLRARLDDEDAE